MSTEVFIEGIQVDIGKDVEALITYAIDDVRQFGAKNTHFSKTIVLPGTNRNNAVFGQAFEFTAYNPYDSTRPNVGANFNAAKAAQCLILQGGVQIFKGVLRLMEIAQLGQNIEYETTVVGELGGLVNAIGEKLLVGNNNTTDDLDFTAYNATWSPTTITNSWNAVAAGGGSGAYYPLIDYGGVSTNKIDYQYSAFRPAFYVREYIDKIITKAGYTWEGSFLNTAFFKRCIIPHNEDKLYVIATQLVGGVTTNVIHFLRKNIFSTTSLTDLFDVDIAFPGAFLRNFSINGSNNAFTYTGAASTSFYFPFSISITNTGTVGTLTATVRKNGVAMITQAINLSTSSGSVSFNYFLTNYPLFTVNTGDVITLHVSLSSVSTVTAPIDMTLQLSQFFIRNTTGQATPAVLNDPLNMQMAIPKGVKQYDLLISVAKMFNLYIVEDKLKSKHLKIVPYVNFYNMGDRLDWSDKVDRSKESRLKPMSELNARYFNFLYDKDSDYHNDDYYNKYNAGYGDRAFDVGLDFVEKKQEVKVIFASSPLKGYVGLDKYVTPLYKKENGTEVAMGTRIRILQGKKKSCTAYSILNSSGSSISSQTNYGYAGHVDDPTSPTGADLNFGAPAEIYWAPSVAYSAPNLFNAFYSAYMAEIVDKDSKLLTCYVRLNPVDIFNLDFGRPIMIDGQLFRLNKIVDYDAVDETPTKVELLKVINLSY